MEKYTHVTIGLGKAWDADGNERLLTDRENEIYNRALAKSFEQCREYKNTTPIVSTLTPELMLATLFPKRVL